VVYIGEQIYGGKLRRFGIAYPDRFKHVNVIGKTGMGKTALLANMAIQDIQNEKYVDIIDTSGELTKMILGRTPNVRENLKVRFAKTLPVRNGHPRFVYLDEVANFVNDDFLKFVSEARRSQVGMTVASQHFSQINDKYLDEFISLFDITIAFRSGHKDAEILEKMFQPKYISADFQNIGPRKFYTNLMLERENLPVLLAKTIELGEPIYEVKKEEVLDNFESLYNEEVSETDLRNILGYE
jgi:hypothetical protein